MAIKTKRSTIQVAFIIAFLTTNVVLSDDNVPIPADKARLKGWFNKNVAPFSQRKNSLDPALVAAENGAKVVKVMRDGSGDFKTITDAINSIPNGNTKRVIVYIGGANYHEKIKIERTKPFVTLYGEPHNKPNLIFGGTAQQYGTVDSATLIVESDYFVAANIIISNSAPRPDGKRPGAQAAALRISGDKATFYNCKLIGFQDTNTKLKVLGDNGMTVIVAQARKSDKEDNVYSFVHCDITGTGSGTFLGRAWFSHSKVVYAYTNMSSVVNPTGWNNNNHPEYDRTTFFGEYKNEGPGADPKKRSSFTKQLSDAEVKPFITLKMIEGSKWLLPPPTPKISSMASNLIVFDEDDIQDCRNSVIGKILSEKPVHINSLSNALKSIWNSPKGFKVIDLGEKIFQIFFETEKEADRVIWGLPVHCRTKQMGQRIGSCMGTTLESFVFEVQGKDTYVIDFNTSKPLLPGINVGSRKEGVFWVDFQFEQLPQFCYKCGVIGHDEDSCTGEQNVGDEDHPRGPWMRASHAGKAVRPEATHLKPKTAQEEKKRESFLF
ncbi:Zinc finger, CCHC-type [Sesbania bispinosa]|nr:Zinc finger, CCHC-type [Sesbania bispinosa]